MQTPAGTSGSAPGCPDVLGGDPSPPRNCSDTEHSRPPRCPRQAAAPEQPRGLSPHARLGTPQPPRSLSSHAGHPPRPGHPMTPQAPHTPQPGHPSTCRPQDRSSPGPARLPAPVPVPSLTAAPPPRPSAPRSRPAAAAASPRPAPARFPLVVAHATPSAAAFIGQGAENAIGRGAAREEQGASPLVEREVGGGGGERAVTCPSGLAVPEGHVGGSGCAPAWPRGRRNHRGRGGSPAREPRPQ